MTDPKLVARFVLDGAGKPVVVSRGDRRHYAIELKIDGVPKDAYAANYKLDDSYYDPERESREPHGFTERITSYGNFDVQVQLRSKIRNAMFSENLAQALKRGHTADAGGVDIQNALKDIETY